jgi:hypothetical protein
MDEKIQRAVEKNAKVRLDDLLEDESLKVEAETVEEIRMICNSTAKQNFSNKVDDLKKHVLPKKDEVLDNLMWLLNYIMTRRLGSQSLPL